MKAVIIEDEQLIATEMKTNIGAVAPDIEVLEAIPSLKLARKWFAANPEPDLLFMDIKLSDGLSFELFDQFRLKCPIIFCTAYEEYAIHAFKVNGVDYLLKPVQVEDLKKAINKVRDRRAGVFPESVELQSLIHFFTSGGTTKQYKERFIISSNNKWTPVETSNIAVFFRDNINYIYTFGGEKHIYDFSALDEIEEVLDPQLFFRANRQAIIHINAIKSVKPYGNQKMLIQLKSPLNMEIDVSREKAPLLRKWMDR